MVQDSNAAGGGIGLPVGAKIGKYEIVERRAIGGQAIVYKGYDRLLDRHVAIKQISSHLAEDPKFLERFRKEAQILAKLGTNQPAIVTIHELIEEPAGLFIVMEFIEGHSLETTFQENPGPIEPKAALQIIWRLAAALHDVHQAGIIHRDIKPSNIIISEGLRPKITDFGVAASLTGQTSMLLGTTKYMAPEMFASTDVDGRADLYALGIVAYEMLLGRAKFNEVFADIIRDPHSEALRWMKWHGSEQTPATPLHELNPAIPLPLSDVVARMMAKNRDLRFGSMEELGRAIKATFSPRKANGNGGRHAARPVAAKGAAQGGRDEGDELEVAAGGVTVAPDTSATAPIPRRKLSLRTKIIAGAAAFVVVLGVVVGVIVPHFMSAAAIEQRANAKAQSEFARGQELYDKHDYGGAEEAFAAARDASRKSVWAAKASVMVPFAQSRRLAETAEQNAEWDQAAAMLKAADDQTNTVAAANKALDGWARDVRNEIGEFQKSALRVKKFRADIAMARAALAGKHYADARAVLDKIMADLTAEQGKIRDELRRKINRADFDDAYAQLLDQGEKLIGQQKFDEAKAVYDKALQLIRNAPKDIMTPEEVAARNKEVDGLTVSQGNQQRFSQAMREAESAVEAGRRKDELTALLRADEIIPSQAVKDRILKVRSLVSLDEAIAFQAGGQASLAMAAVDEALKFDPENTRAQQLKKDLAKSVDREALINSGKVAYDAGNYVKALADWVKASEIQSDEALTGMITDAQFKVLLAEGDKYRDAAQYDKAIERYEIARKRKPSEGPTIDARLADCRQKREYNTWLVKGDAALKDKDYSSARSFFRKAETQLPTAEIKQRLALVSYEEYLSEGKAALQKGDVEEAKPALRRARDHKDAAGIKTTEVDDLLRRLEPSNP